MPSMRSHDSSMRRSSTPQVNAPCDPPPCSARSTNTGSRAAPTCRLCGAFKDMPGSEECANASQDVNEILRVRESGFSVRECLLQGPRQLAMSCMSALDFSGQHPTRSKECARKMRFGAIGPRSNSRPTKRGARSVRVRGRSDGAFRKRRDAQFDEPARVAAQVGSAPHCYISRVRSKHVVDRYQAQCPVAIGLKGH